MKHFRLLFLFIFTAIFAAALAQGGRQIGYVKTPGRLGKNGSVIAGTRISDATITIKGGGTTRSAAKSGTFTITLPGGVQKFYLQKVQKIGYSLVDMEVLGKQYTCSSNPLVLVMETPTTQAKTVLTQETKLRESFQRELKKREKEIEELKNNNKITVQEYDKRIQELLAQQETSERLISEMAERYAKMDFDQIDEFNRRIADCILEGRLEEADSLIKSKGDIHERILQVRQEEELEAIRDEEIRKQLESNEQAKAGTKAAKEDIAQDCYHHYEIYKLENQRDSAAYYIRLRAELDTTNVSWQNDVGLFFKSYMADYDTALTYHERGLKQAILQYGEESELAATCYKYIGDVYYDNEIYVTAPQYYYKALRIRLKVLGEMHPDVAQSYRDIAFIYSFKHEYAKAMEYINNALQIQLKVLGEMHPDVAICYNNMASVFLFQKEYDKTLEYYDKALRIRLKVFGEQDKSVATCYNGIGLVYYMQGEYDKALEYYDKALASTRLDNSISSRPALASVYNNIGSVYNAKGEYLKALEYFNKALEIELFFFGEVYPSVARIYYDISCIYKKLGNSERCDYFGEKEMEIIEYRGRPLKVFPNINLYGDNHPDVAMIYSDIGIEYYNQAKYDKAMENYNKALDIWLKVLGEQHPNVAASYNNIGLIYEALGDTERANEYYNKAEKIQNELEK